MFPVAPRNGGSGKPLKGLRARAKVRRPPTLHVQQSGPEQPETRLPSLRLQERPTAKSELPAPSNPTERPDAMAFLKTVLGALAVCTTHLI